MNVEKDLSNSYSAEPQTDWLTQMYWYLQNINKTVGFLWGLFCSNCLRMILADYCTNELGISTFKKCQRLLSRFSNVCHFFIINAFGNVFFNYFWCLTNQWFGGDWTSHCGANTGSMVFTARCTSKCKARSCDRMLSVCPSVTLVDCDHIGWNSSEIISPLVSLGCSLSADLNIRGPVQGEHPEILAQSDPPPVDLSVGDIRSQIATEWLQIQQIAQRSQWRAYRKPPSLFRMVPSLTPYDLPFSPNGVPYAPKIREWPYLRNEWSDTLYVWF